MQIEKESMVKKKGDFVAEYEYGVVAKRKGALLSAALAVLFFVTPVLVDQEALNPRSLFLVWLVFAIIMNAIDFRNMHLYYPLSFYSGGIGIEKKNLWLSWHEVKRIEVFGESGRASERDKDFIVGLYSRGVRVHFDKGVLVIYRGIKDFRKLIKQIEENTT